jgi:hypothetical protein
MPALWRGLYYPSHAIVAEFFLRHSATKVSTIGAFATQVTITGTPQPKAEAQRCLGEFVSS